MLGLEKGWKHDKTVKQAQQAAKKMFRCLPAWKLKDCIEQLCGDAPKIIGAARASNVYFVNARTLAELMGGCGGVQVF